jgi:hypothetical protein
MTNPAGCEHIFQNGKCTLCGKYDFAGTFTKLYSDDALEDSAVWRAELEVERENKARAESRDRYLAQVAYKSHKAGKALSSEQITLLVRYGYAYYTETTENEYGGELVIK